MFQNQGLTVIRKRGRPAGRNRVALTLEERRARNAQYERERREETAAATRELAEAAGCPPDISTGDLLTTVIETLRRRMAPRPGDEIADLRRVNKKLKAQVIKLERMLGQEQLPSQETGAQESPPALPVQEPPLESEASGLQLLSPHELQYLENLFDNDRMGEILPSEVVCRYFIGFD
ncbi:uncharacterized protein LOC114247781 [Bombyx mandarina]|uniref:Uncharacterized protein LOC114247781 n=1 Tax=Bombyx mandarina TaxID=7092 RepID=A0A6J2K6M9_BOMMA|nr:uncharacterized protein LOC114247781 [Bombyx mandarina]